MYGMVHLEWTFGLIIYHILYGKTILRIQLERTHYKIASFSVELISVNLDFLLSFLSAAFVIIIVVFYTFVFGHLDLYSSVCRTYEKNLVCSNPPAMMKAFMTKLFHLVDLSV